MYQEDFSIPKSCAYRLYVNRYIYTTRTFPSPYWLRGWQIWVDLLTSTSPSCGTLLSPHYSLFSPCTSSPPVVGVGTVAVWGGDDQSSSNLGCEISHVLSLTWSMCLWYNLPSVNFTRNDRSPLHNYHCSKENCGKHMLGHPTWAPSA